MKNAEEKDKMEAILKDKLTDAFTSGTAFTTDWDKEPLPLLVSVSVLLFLYLLNRAYSLSILHACALDFLINSSCLAFIVRI